MIKIVVQSDDKKLKREQKKRDKELLKLQEEQRKLFVQAMKAIHDR